MLVSFFRNQTSLMLPFSFTFDEDSSSSRRLYRWKRVLLKVSGEALAGNHTENIDPKVNLLLVEHL
jgi:uridylate kinase